MSAKVANKLNDLNCEYAIVLREKVDEENYGLQPCAVNSLSSMDRDPKFNQLKKDFIKHYLNYTDNQLYNIKNECDVLKIIKKL